MDWPPPLFFEHADVTMHDGKLLKACDADTVLSLPWWAI
jgi:hypothetical protein